MLNFSRCDRTEFGLYIHLMQPSYKRKQPQNRYRGVVLRIMAQVFWCFLELRVIYRTITVQICE